MLRNASLELSAGTMTASPSKSELNRSKFDPSTAVMQIAPTHLKFGVIPNGFYYNLKFSIKNNTLSPMRVRVECTPTYGEKNSIRIVHLPDLVAPGMSTSITLELSSEFPGMAKFQLRVSQNHDSFVLERDIDAHIVTQETFKYVKKSLQIQRRPVHQPNVEAAGPMVGLVQGSTHTPITSFSEALIMDDEDMDDLLDLPMTSTTYWDPFAKCLRIDPQLGHVIVDKDISMEESLRRTMESRKARQEELEEQGFLTMETMDRLREDREKNEMNDPYDRPDHFGGFDSTHEMDNEAVESGGEEDDEMGMTTGSQKSMASVSSLLALKRDRIDLKRRATINASSQFADNSRNDNMVNATGPDEYATEDPVIPVRTWTTGSPYKVALPHLRDFDANQKLNSDEIEWENGLENYFFGDEAVNLPEEGEDEEDEDEDGEEGEEDGEYEDDDEEGGEDEDGDEYEEDYEPDEEGGNEEADQADEDQQAMEDFQRLFQARGTPVKAAVKDDYTDAYQELLQYLGSPRRVDDVEADLPNASMQNGLFIAGRHQAQVEEDEDANVFEEQARLQYIKEMRKMIQKEKASKAKQSKSKVGAKKSKKPSKPIDPKKRAEVEGRHKAMLSDMVNKRKLEEEDLLRQVQLAEQKRKKFKEALLEKALKARKEQAKEEEDSKFNSKTPQQVIQTDADLVRREEEKREYVAAIRRKFKEQHKKVLNDLFEKKKSHEMKAEQDVLLEELKKQKHKKKLLRMLSQKSDGISPVKPLDEDQRAQSAEALLHESPSAALAAGSGLAVVRQRASVTQPSYDRPKKGAAANPAESDDSAEAEDAGGSPEDEAVKVLAKQQKKKISDYLRSLTEQKKKEEAEKKKAEDRQRRRIQLLAQRLALEAAERKLMNQQDSPKYQSGDKVPEQAEKVASKKITAEMAEAMAERLRQKSLQSRNVAIPVPAPAAKPKEPREPREPRELKEVKEPKESKEPVKPPPRPRKVPSDPAVEVEVNVSTSASMAIPTVPARDFNDWKRKNSVPKDARVFCMTGWYPCVKQALLDRGWYFNPDPASPYCHLKWTLRSIDVNQDTLLPWQLTNHYLKNVAITTKAGLIKSLQSLVWLADVDAKDIIPRAYDLSIHHELQAFMDDFRCQKAEQILKQLYLSIFQKDSPILYAKKDVDVFSPPNTAREGTTVVDEDDVVTIPPMPAPKEAMPQINPVIFEAACRILEAQLQPYDDTYLDAPMQQYDITSCLYNHKMVGSLEWELISSYSLHSTVRSLPFPAPEPIDAFMAKDEEDSGLSQQQMQREKKKLSKMLDDAREEASDQLKKLRLLTTDDLQRVHLILCRLSLHHRGQHGLNGSGSTCGNMWIVKPAAKSRGRGITTFADLPKLLKYVEAGSGLSTQWIVQKYIENPLVIAKRKFDLRQWVLVTDWNPLTIYFYDECYARFSVEEYSNSSQDLENCYIHLVNNSIGKNSENFGKVVTAENGVNIEGYMWSFDQFGEYLKENNQGQDVLRSKIQPRMKDIAKWSLMCASEMIEHRKNSWELYGFDYMVDDALNTWLIEINSSPACDYSTKVTEKYVQKALVELLNVVLDVREWDALPKKTRGNKPDTGGWECIYTGPQLELPLGAFGTEMSLKGEQLKSRVPRPMQPPAVNITPVVPQPPAGNNHAVGARPRPMGSTAAMNNFSAPTPVASASSNIENRRNREEPDEPAFNDSDGEDSQVGGAHKPSHTDGKGSRKAAAVPLPVKRELKPSRASSSGVSIPVKVLTLDLGF